MARARNIKPAFFKNESLVDLPFEHRLLFVGLWTLADKAGRLEDRPRKIKMEIFPEDDVNVMEGLSLLEGKGFIDRYKVGELEIIQIINFGKHQSPHHTEKASELPAKPEPKGAPDINEGLTVKEQKQDGENPPDSLIPDSLIPDSNNVAGATEVTSMKDEIEKRRAEGFELFWAIYPKKSARKDAIKAWKKINPNLYSQILDAIVANKAGKAWMDSNGQYIPLPASWLNGERWHDEIVPYVPSDKPKSQGAWWLDDASRFAKAAEVGVTSIPGESAAAFDARIREAINNGGKPPERKPGPAVRISLEQGDDQGKAEVSDASRAALLAAAGINRRPA